MEQQPPRAFHLTTHHTFGVRDSHYTMVYTEPPLSAQPSYKLPDFTPFGADAVVNSINNIIWTRFNKELLQQ